MGDVKGACRLCRVPEVERQPGRTTVRFLARLRDGDRILTCVARFEITARLATIRRGRFEELASSRLYEYNDDSGKNPAPHSQRGADVAHIGNRQEEAIQRWGTQNFHEVLILQR